jgi:hypothetical protein
MEREVPDGWHKMEDLRWTYMVILPPIILLTCVVAYFFLDLEMSLVNLAFFGTLVLVGFVLILGFNIGRKFKQSVARTFRLRDYEQLPLLKRLKRFKEDLRADPMDAKGPKLGTDSPSEYYWLGEDRSALMGVSYDNIKDRFWVTFHLVPATYDSADRVELFASSRGWDGE